MPDQTTHRLPCAADTEEWRGLAALDWWMQAIQLMHHTGQPLDCSFRFQNALVEVRVEIAAVRGHVPAARH